MPRMEERMQEFFDAQERDLQRQRLNPRDTRNTQQEAVTQRLREEQTAADKIKAQALIEQLRKGPK